MQQALKLYNSQTQRKEIFQPLQAGQVKMYCCGPTVYDFLHVGNFRGAVFYNFVRNWLTELGYQVTYVYNFTDVDDKILRRAREEGVSAKEVSERFIAEFWQDFRALQLKPHTHNPKVTEHMQEIVQLISDLITNQKAYVVDGEVFFSIDSFTDYGKLSHRKPEDMISGARIEIDPKKRNPLDFTLWKPAKPGEQAWASPWGEGRPGWHIECSAMTRALLGDQVDIHGGGMDLIFPHHENEIAQSEGCSGKPYVKYWLHNNMFTFSGAKMSKSLGNIRTMRNFLGQYHGEIFKYLVLSVHYRSEAEFSETTIQNAVAALGRIYSALAKAQSFASGPLGEPKTAEGQKMLAQILASEAKMTDFVNDDFATPQLMAQIFENIRVFNQLVPGIGAVKPGHGEASALFQSFFAKWGSLLALFQEQPVDFLRQLDDLLLAHKSLKRDDVQMMVDQRWQARLSKDYPRSDELRLKLTEMGIELRDTAQGTVWEVRKGGN